MPNFETERCEISDLPVLTCAHCTQGTKTLPAGLTGDGDPEDGASQGVVARYPGSCSVCGAPILAGRTVIHPDGIGGWLCPNCID